MASLVDLDELMFAPSGWFVIGTDNQAVAGVRVASLEAGLMLVGEGAVASVVGRLRPELQVVDVDLAGERGDAAVAQLVTWCRENGVWYLVRPSGGGPGRAHVFVAPGEHRAGLSAHVQQVRSDLRASAKAVDLRASGHVRPLSAPHRLGGHTRPLGVLRDALRGLRAHSWAGTAAPVSRRASSSQGQSRALTPRMRRRTDLPEQWERYLRTGKAPAHGGSDHSRTTDELLATGAMLRAGHSADSAWALITAAHAGAMVRARASRRRWVAWVWNRVVEDDLAHSPTSEVAPEVAAAVAAARAALTDLMWQTPPRQRRALLLVGHHLLDRMERANKRRVPVPERDLVQDTCLTDRKTIRTVLRRLHGALGHLHTDTWDPNRRDSSSFEFEIPPAEGMRLIPPPSFHTPSPAAPRNPAPALPRGTWTQLPGSAHALWRTLLTTDEPLTPRELARRSGLTATAEQEPTPAQRRAIMDALSALAGAGLAHCTVDGTWTHRHAPTPEHSERAEQRHQEIRDAVEAERRAYRSPATEWSVARARALKAQLAKERAWWNGLDPVERRDRRTRWRSRFDTMSVLDQERTKTDLATRRIRAGVDERDRHDAWLNSLPTEELQRRSAERQHRYAQLAPPLQQAHVAAWQRHRDRFGIPRSASTLTTRAEHRALLPDGPAIRDAAFLDDQLPIPGTTVADAAG